ncbi:MAG TPA: hypothetical protein EYP61_09370 [Candidatus Latescibacteria bacterium]|nr:hypothetical protein [Candidatus Latescibacterota bacterium]
MPKVLRINPSDNVAVALEPVGEGEEVEVSGLKIRAKQAVPPGHKLALSYIPRGSEVVKYGSPIGKATRDISTGEWVHTHNLKGSRGRDEVQRLPEA